MRNFYKVALCAMVLFVFLASCGIPSFENVYDNPYFSVEYPSIFEVIGSSDTDIVITQIGNISPMMRFTMVEMGSMTKGDTMSLQAQYTSVSEKALDVEMRNTKVDGVRSLFVRMVYPGGITGMSVTELMEYSIPLDGKLLRIELTPQIPDDIELGHDIVRTIRFHENH